MDAYLVWEWKWLAWAIKTDASREGLDIHTTKQASLAKAVASFQWSQHSANWYATWNVLALMEHFFPLILAPCFLSGDHCSRPDPFRFARQAKENHLSLPFWGQILIWDPPIQFHWSWQNYSRSVVPWGEQKQMLSLDCLNQKPQKRILDAFTAWCAQDQTQEEFMSIYYWHLYQTNIDGFHPLDTFS